MATMACIYCSKPVGNNQPMTCCLNCDWLHTMKDNILEEMYHYIDQENRLKEQLKEVQKRKKQVEKNYENIWEEMTKRFLS